MSVVPGERLALASEFVTGPGTYQRGQHIYASVVGWKQTGPAPVDTPGGSARHQVWVSRDTTASVEVPSIGSTVIAVVTKMTPRSATLRILFVGAACAPLKQAYLGIIRQQDVRATEIDKVEIYRSFRPGDVVRAEVISLGDARQYILSTAKNELGVLLAKSVAAGVTMVPHSWEEMICPQTKTKEYRKVAQAQLDPATLTTASDAAAAVVAAEPAD